MSRELRDLAEDAVQACLPILPLQGDDTGYQIAKYVDPTLIATREEWMSAAHAIAELHKALRKDES